MRFPRTLSRIAAAHPRIFRPRSHEARCPTCRNAPTNPHPMSPAGIAATFSVPLCMVTGSPQSTRDAMYEANRRAFRDFLEDPVGPPLDAKDDAIARAFEREWQTHEREWPTHTSGEGKTHPGPKDLCVSRHCDPSRRHVPILDADTLTRETAAWPTTVEPRLRDVLAEDTRRRARMSAAHDLRRDRDLAAQARQDAARRDELDTAGKHGGSAA